MDNGDKGNKWDEVELVPTLTTIDVQRGFKELTVYLKSGEERKLQVRRITWPDLAAIHLADPKTAEMEVLHACVPPQPWPDVEKPYEWLEWLDMDSHNEVCCVVREFAYGFRTEKKRTEDVRQFGRTWLARIRTRQSSASGSDSATPSSGAAPSSSPTPNASEESKLTTV